MADPRTVLIVDDSTTLAKQLAKILEESARFKVVGHASDGLAAVKEFKNLSPAIVCMDVVMPNLDGVAATRMLKQINPDAKIVIISSVGGVAEKVKECLSSGASNVISKPFDAKKVLAILDSI